MGDESAVRLLQVNLEHPIVDLGEPRVGKHVG